MTETSKQGELKPCPFCGGEAMILIHDTEETYYAKICCENLACQCTVSSQPEVEDAVGLWNQRKGNTELEKSNQELVGLIEEYLDDDGAFGIALRCEENDKMVE